MVLSVKSFVFHSQEPASFLCRVRGSGLTSATVDHVLVQMTDSSGRPHRQEQRISAHLELVSNPDSNSQPRVTSLPVIMTSLSEYEVSYTPVSRGQHKLRYSMAVISMAVPLLSLRTLTLDT